VTAVSARDRRVRFAIISARLSLAREWNEKFPKISRERAEPFAERKQLLEYPGS